MALLDYLPPLYSTPELYKNILTPQEQAGLEKRASLGGLLGFAGALAQGMSPQGYRRSAAENILSALGAGFGGASQTFQSGIGQMAELQKLQQGRAQIDAINTVLADPTVDPQIKAFIRINPAEGIKYLMENAPLMRILNKPRVEPQVQPEGIVPVTTQVVQPRVEPREVVEPEGLITSKPEPFDVVRTQPKELPAGESDFAEWQKLVRAEAEGKTPEQLSEAAKIALAETNAALAANQPRAVTTPSGLLPQGESIELNPPPVVEYKEPSAAPAPVPAPVSVATAPVTSNDLARLNARKKQLLDQNEELSIIPSKRADELIKRNSEQIDTIDKQINRLAVSQFNFQGVEDLVPPQFKNRVANLRKAAADGTLTMDQLTQKLQSIEKDAIEFVSKRTDYTNQDRRVAAGMFRNPDGTSKAIEELNAVELMQLENKLFDLDIQKRRAGATTINMPTESERTAGYLTTRLKNSFEQYQRVLGEDATAAMPSLRAEIIKGVTKSDYLKNLATPENRQRVEAAQLDMISAALTLSTGAAYTKEELEAQRSTYFPQLGDKPATIRDKAVRLDKLLKEAAMVKAGRAAPSAPSDVSPAFDMDAIQRELDRRKGK